MISRQNIHQISKNRINWNKNDFQLSESLWSQRCFGYTFIYCKQLNPINVFWKFQCQRIIFNKICTYMHINTFKTQCFVLYLFFFVFSSLTHHNSLWVFPTHSKRVAAKNSSKYIFNANSMKSNWIEIDQ